MAGFRGPLFLLGLGSGATQAGFRSTIPLPFIAGTVGVIQAGFIGVIPFVNLGSDGTVTPPNDEYTKPTEPMCKSMCDIMVKRMDSDWKPD